MPEEKENKMDKRGLKCPFMKEGEITCGEKCALFIKSDFCSGCVFLNILGELKSK